MRIHIDLPWNYIIGPTAEQIKSLMQDGLEHWQIMSKLRIGIQQYRDCVFEIRKQEAIIMAKLTDEQRQEIIRLHDTEGWTNAALAKEYRVTPAAITNILKHRAQKPVETVSAEPEQAVPEIEQQAEQPEEPAERVSVPDEVIEAVRDRIKLIRQNIADLREDIISAENTVRKCREAIEEYKNKRDTLCAWIKENVNEST